MCVYKLPKYKTYQKKRRAPIKMKEAKQKGVERGEGRVLRKKKAKERERENERE